MNSAALAGLKQRAMLTDAHDGSALCLRGATSAFGKTRA
jgi:hypothetical protein